MVERTWIESVFAGTPDLLTVAEVASAMRVRPATVQRWITGTEHPLPVMVLPGRYLVIRDELVAWLESHQPATTPAAQTSPHVASRLVNASR